MEKINESMTSGQIVLEDKNILLLCNCCSSGHHIIFRKFAPTEFDTKEDKDTIYLSVHLDQLSFWKRLWRGLGYIVGRRGKFGDFAEIVTKKEKLQSILNDL